MKVALVVGHKKYSPGVCNKSNKICEFEFNTHLVHAIKDWLDVIAHADKYFYHFQRNIFGNLSLQEKIDISSVIVFRDSYYSLPYDVNELNPDFIISFHCNGFNCKVSGTETLYYHESVTGKKLAELLQHNIVGALGLHDRGIKPKSSEDRGGYLLSYTKAPCVIIEPFFLDNDDDYKVVMENYNALVFSIVYSIVAFEANKKFI